MELSCWIKALALSAVLFLLAFRQPGARASDTVANKTGKWEASIEAFEQSDSLHPPPRHAVLFIGSSTIVLWKSLAQDFPGVHIINRGFGGCEISDINHYANRIIFPYAPDRIFFRAGSNDLHSGLKPGQVFDEFKKLAGRIHAGLPDADFYYIALSPSIARRTEADDTKCVNEMIRDYVSRIPHFKYIDAWSVTLDDHGYLREDLFRTDKLHLNDRGYKILTERVRPYLESPLCVPAR